MKSIGSHRTKSGKLYDLVYISQSKSAQAILIPVHPGAGVPALELKANSEDEALQKLIEALDAGDF